MEKKSLWRAWVIWSLSALFMFYKNAIEVSPSVMTGTLMGAFQITATELGNLTAAYFYAYLLLQVPVGLLIDRFGPRRVTTIAIMICAMGMMIFAEAETLFVAGIGRFLTGVGAAFAAVNCMKLTASWFAPRQFAFMTGLMMTIAMLGAVGGQAPLAAFITSMGWRTAMIVLACIGFGLAAAFWLIVRDRTEGTVLVRRGMWQSLKGVLKDPQSWWVSFYSGFAFAPVMVFGGLWGVSFVKDAFHLTHNMAAQAVSLIFIGFAIGGPVFGWFSGYIGKRSVVMFWGTLTALISITAVIYMPSLSATMINALLFTFGFSISSFLLCFAMIQEMHTVSLAATAVGFMNAFDALFGAISDPLAGKILDMHWTGAMHEGARVFALNDYRMAFLIIPIYLVTALLTLIWIRETKPKVTNPTTLP